MHHAWRTTVWVDESALWAGRSLRASGASGASRTISSGRTDCALWAGRSLRASGASRTISSGRTDCAISSGGAGAAL